MKLLSCTFSRSVSLAFASLLLFQCDVVAQARPLLRPGQRSLKPAPAQLNKRPFVAPANNGAFLPPTGGQSNFGQFPNSSFANGPFAGNPFANNGVVGGRGNFAQGGGPYPSRSGRGFNSALATGPNARFGSLNSSFGAFSPGFGGFGPINSSSYPYGGLGPISSGFYSPYGGFGTSNGGFFPGFGGSPFGY